MNGVTILEECEISGFSETTANIIISISIIFATALFVWLLYGMNPRPFSVHTAVGLIITILVMLTGICTAMITAQDKTHTEYVIRIDDPAGFDQVTEHYEIVRKNNDGTYVIREKQTQ